MELVKILILLLGLSGSLMAAENQAEFKHFRLKGALKERANHFFNNKNLKFKSLRSNEEGSDLYREILDGLRDSYQTLGEKLAGNIINLNREFDLGNENFKGINWQRPFGNFSIAVNRQLSPDLFDDTRWIVDDTFVIYINASTYLSNLQQSGELEISEKDLALYAGITFKRTYRYVHFADSFLHGLVSDYSKLFMSFWKMRKADIFNLASYEILSKEDSMSVQAGGIISSPNYGTGNVNGGVLAKYNKVSKIMIQALGSQDGEIGHEVMRLSISKDKGIEATGKIRLQADFFKLLKITLLSYDTTYSYSETDSKYLSFTQGSIDEINSDPNKKNELLNLLRLKKVKLRELAPYKTLEEYREEENFSSKYSALIWGGEAQRGSETILLNNLEKTKAFVVHHARSVRFREKIWAKLAGVIFAALFESDKYLAQYSESITREVSLEFEASEKALERGEFDSIRDIDSSDKLSLKISKEFKTRKKFKTKSRWKKSSEKTRVMAFARKFSALKSSVLRKLESGSLRSPLAINTVLRIEKAGIDYFNHLSREVIFDQITALCRNSESDQSKFEYCKKMLDGKFKAYIIPFLSTGKIKVLALKNFLYSLNKQVDDFSYLKTLFGEEHVFISGALESLSSSGTVFQTYFNQGQFEGLGVIDKFSRENGLIVPAPIFLH